MIASYKSLSVARFAQHPTVTDLSLRLTVNSRLSPSSAHSYSIGRRIGTDVWIMIQTSMV